MNDNTEYAWILLIFLGISSCSTLLYTSSVRENELTRHYIDKGYTECRILGSQATVFKKDCKE